MDLPEGTIWFVGDLSDPWVVSIAEACSRSSGLIQLHCVGDLPDRPFDAARPPRLVVLHRQRLTSADAQRLSAYRDRAAPGAAPAIVLCVGPYVRYEELERWSGLADLVLSEATAADILPWHVARLVEGREGRTTRAAAARFRIEVAGGNHDLCQALVEACASAGYRALQVDDLDMPGGAGPHASPRAATEPVLTIWDVPVLEPDWTDRLERRSRSSGPVIALCGFADRTTVARAKSRGAIACLELPYNIDDLLDVIDRAAGSLPIERWPVPARVELPHRLPPRPRRRRDPRETPAVAPPWSDRDRKPTIA
jgi:hypothetical protein